MAAACIISSPLHNSRENEEEKRGIHLQEENNYEYALTKDIIILFHMKRRCHCDKATDKIQNNR